MKKHKTGDKIQVSADEVTWFERIFLVEIDGRYLCVNNGYEEQYLNGKQYQATSWKHAITYDKPLTLEQAVKYLQENLKDNYIVDSSGASFTNYEGIGIMYTKHMKDPNIKFYRGKKH